jgi:WD40 repeat protein
MNGHPSGIAWSPDGKYLADARHNSSVWNAKTHEEAAIMPRGVSSSSDKVRYSPDGKSVVLCGPLGVQLWDVSGLFSLNKDGKE